MERLFEDGRHQLLEQMDIVKLFTELRILKTIVLMKVTLTKEEIDEVKENAVMKVKDEQEKPEIDLPLRRIEIHEQSAVEIFSYRT